MSLRTRIAALTAGAVAVAVLVVSVGAWVLVRRELRQQVDETLVRRVAAARAPGRLEISSRGVRADLFEIGLDNAVQLIDRNGNVLLTTGSSEIPVDERDIAIAARAQRAYLHDERVDGVHLRVLTAPAAPGQAAMLARDMSEVDRTLRGFTIVVLVLAGLGIAGAAAAGLVVARRAVAPVERLTSAAEHVANTKELNATIDVQGQDELARLGHSFNQMLAALSQSQEQQRRLVADASHELRTPLTSLRTNVEVLMKQTKITPAQRQRVLADLNSELTELSALVTELVALATEQRNGDEEEMTEIRLDEIAESAVDRARRRTGRTIELKATESAVLGRPLALERAIGNLIDNACKWGPPDEPIDVTVDDGRLEVRDRGPGIAAQDRPHVFDRFYRATAARSMPGSGLGLSIVRQVVESHGGRVWAAEPEEGPGAVVGFAIPSGDS